jgi:hypothetical protein
MPSNNQKEVILGQLLNEKVKCLKSHVQVLFPNKKYHIGELANAMEEQDKEVKTDCIAVSMPEITECIAIWINPDLPNEEFNSVLAEELFHHIQASEQYPTIVGLNATKRGVNFTRFASQLEAFCKNLVSIICDLDAHSRMLDYGIDLETILATDLRLVTNAIAESDSSESKLIELRQGKAIISSFPPYLLWWFDLCELGFPKYVKIWNEDIRPWFVQKLSKDTMECWDELTEFIHNNPVTDSKSAERAIRVICERLVCGTPNFVPIRTSGRSVSHLC